MSDPINTPPSNHRTPPIPQTPPPLNDRQHTTAHEMVPAAVTAQWAAEARYSIVDWFKKAVKNFVNFSDRARRKEYWYYTLIASCIVLAAALIDGMMGMEDVVVSIVGLILFLPSIAVSIRRLHDINKSGWWYLVSLIPLIGGLIMLFWTCTDTKPNKNQWGYPARNVR